MPKKPPEKEKKQNGKKKVADLQEKGLKHETKQTIYAIVAFFLAIFFAIAAFGGGGVAGSGVYGLLKKLFGVGYIFLPLSAALLGISLIGEYRARVSSSHLVASLIFLFSALSIIDIASVAHAGGMVGKFVAWPFIRLFDKSLAILLFGALVIIALLMLFDAKPALVPFFKKLWALITGKKEVVASATITSAEEKKIDAIANAEIARVEHTERKDEPQQEEPKKKKTDDEMAGFQIASIRRASAYTPPPLSLLEGDRGKANVGDIKGNANIIKRTLANFGIQVEMDEITVGPSVTRYALKPAEGVKLARIVGLQNDLALALAAHPIRIEAPIPGKSLVGVEIPNKTKSTVGLASLLEDSEYKNSEKPLFMGVGRGLSGRAKFINLAKMPHMLIAGTTGAGKSVTIHTLITSLLYRLGPEDLRFIMIDPKRVELTLYNKIPHLLTPVITDAKKAILSLKWAAKEMERRYNILETEAVRDIDSYHKLIGNRKPKDGEEVDRMPFIVIILDELADIMSSYPRELEAGIVRLAQMSRAVGIHLILSTQRPEVNVITGLIKANVPARVALKVSSQIDSRTILDTGGAEKLLGAGDMLFISGESSQPERIQSAFITEDEVKRVAAWLGKTYENEVIGDIALTGTPSVDKSIFEATLDSEDNADDDEMYESAKQAVMEAGKASTSYLQRKLKLGYARAARLMDILEERGVVGPADGAKPREVLIKNDMENPELGA
ncbi:MAG: cell division protein ftsK, segregation ATPase FtsK/SpoIIIE, family [Candidatus Parcubacteria bacterium]|jgi:S-DNA-T family DNA segregation ATPase FtsK/SpoIIIE